MCVNKEVSIGAFIICSVSCLYLYKRNHINDRWIAVLFFYFGLMQFLEYLMWIDQECSGLNQSATNMAYIHNILQPIISLCIAFFYAKGKLPSYLYIVFIIYLVYSLPKIMEMKKEGQCSLPCKTGNLGLSWEYTNTVNSEYVWGIFCLGISLPLLTMKKNGGVYTSIIMILYTIACFISTERCPNAAVPSSGSWWCMMASLVPLIAIKLN